VHSTQNAIVSFLRPTVKLPDGRIQDCPPCWNDFGEMLDTPYSRMPLATRVSAEQQKYSSHTFAHSGS
jgi:hypothetical protein